MACTCNYALRLQITGGTARAGSQRTAAVAARGAGSPRPRRPAVVHGDSQLAWPEGGRGSNGSRRGAHHTQDAPLPRDGPRGPGDPGGGTEPSSSRHTSHTWPHSALPPAAFNRPRPHPLPMDRAGMYSAPVTTRGKARENRAVTRKGPAIDWPHASNTNGSAPINTFVPARRVGYRRRPSLNGLRSPDANANAFSTTQRSAK